MNKWIPRFFRVRKDGGPDSNVTGYWLIEWKPVFSIALLRFSEGSRENYHSHAFNAWSWILRGALIEERVHHAEPGIIGSSTQWLTPSILPVFTGRGNLHRVYGWAPVTWALTLRGPWRDTWTEVTPRGEHITLTHGRKVL